MTILKILETETKQNYKRRQKVFSNANKKAKIMQCVKSVHIGV